MLQVLMMITLISLLSQVNYRSVNPGDLREKRPVTTHIENLNDSHKLISQIFSHISILSIILHTRSFIFYYTAVEDILEHGIMNFTTYCITLCEYCNKMLPPPGNSSGQAPQNVKVLKHL